GRRAWWVPTAGARAPRPRSVRAAGAGWCCGGASRTRARTSGGRGGAPSRGSAGARRRSRRRARHAPRARTGLVAGVPGAVGIDLESASLGVLEEGAGDAGLERIRILNDRLGVVGDQGAEHPAVELPGRLAGLDGARGGLREAWVDEAVARHPGGEDPGAQAPALTPQVGLEVPHPAGVDLELVAGLAVG